MVKCAERTGAQLSKISVEGAGGFVFNCGFTMASPIRVRFAPSPTGFFHIGSARTALFNWLYARHTGGTFILRIEDTDTARNSDEYLRILIESMQWLGLDWDEGPGKEGACGPYFQSQRNDIYKQYLQKLIDAGRVYEKEGAYFFKLVGERKTVFDEFKKAEVEVVDAAPVTIRDAIHGDVQRAETQDFVVWRSNGDPSFHFVNVVDDIAMGITHVIRGADHLSNTSKHVELFNAFGVTPPVFAHIPLILKSSGQGKMSKREQGALIEEYQNRHFLPEAVRNYLCLLGWNPKVDQEIMPIEEIIARFDLPGINKANARFDEKKMAHFNTVYTQQLSAPRFAELGAQVLRQAKLIDDATDTLYVADVLALCQPKLTGLEALPAYADYFFTDTFPEDAASREKTLKKGGVEAARARLQELAAWAAEQSDWTDAALEAGLKTLAETKAVGTGEYIHAARLALSGRSVGPSFYGLLRVLGRQRVQSRITAWLDKNN